MAYDIINYSQSFPLDLVYSQHSTISKLTASKSLNSFHSAIFCHGEYFYQWFDIMLGSESKHFCSLCWSCGTTRGETDLALQEWQEGNDYRVEVDGERVDCTEWIHDRNEALSSISKRRSIFL